MIWRIWLQIYGVLVLGLPLALPAVVGQARATERVTAHPALDYAGSPSTDGRFLAFVSEQNGNADIWLKSLTAGVFSPPRPLTTHPGKDVGPALNANGSSLLYVSYRTDPRGDVFLLDVPTGKESRLTDQTSGDSAPAWGTGDTMYYLRDDLKTGARGIVRASLATGRPELIVEGALSFAVSPEGRLVYSDGHKLLAVDPASPKLSQPLTSGKFVDAWPSFVDANTVVFTRYQEDTNHDGVVDADDESSLYVGRWDFSTGERQALYRLTPGNEFHLYPVAAGPYIYYSDLKRQDIYRLHLPDFLQAYSDVSQARELAAILLDRGETPRGLLTLTNISVNLVPQLPLAEQAEFDLELVELLREARRYATAKEVLARYAQAGGKIGALYRLSWPILSLEEQAPVVSPRELKKTVERLTKELLAVASVKEQDDTVRAVAFLEAGRLHLLADDPLTALTFLVKVENSKDTEVRAKALFARAKVYQRLGEENKLQKVFLDVIAAFGEQSFLGRRAVARAVAIADQPEDVRKAVASLTALADRHREFPYLATSAFLRAAERYDEQGETTHAIETLDRAIQDFGSQASLVADVYRKKGAILAAAQRYEEAAKAYGAVVDLTGRSLEELEQAQELMVLQYVRSATRKRELGEVRIAAKEFRRLVDAHPDSIEAHRGYIETKVMLGELDEVQVFYGNLSRTVPDKPSYRYGLGLALSYSTPPNVARVIETIEEATKMNPGISYFHQTLGWAYEQAERLGKSGALEKAEREYRIALELNDGFRFPDVESNLLLNLGNSYMGLGNYAEAYRHYARRREVVAAGDDPMRELLYHKSYGEACFKTGRTDESIVQYERALALVPKDKPELKAELLERMGLSEQDAGHYARAVQYYSEALELNIKLGTTGNLARLRRNIGVNLYNVSISGGAISRGSLKGALKSQLESLETLDRDGVQQKATGKGLLQIQVDLGGAGTSAAGGFDRRGEEKLMFSYIARTYEELSEPASAKEYYLKKLALISSDGAPTQAVAAQTEEAVVLNRLGVLSHALGQADESVSFLKQSLARTKALGLGYGMRVNLYNLSRLAAERQLAGGPVELSLVETVVGGLEGVLQEPNPDRLTVYLLANASYLLAGMDRVRGLPGQTVESRTGEIYRVYRAQQEAVSFLRTALRLVEKENVLPLDEAAYLRLVLKLNLLDLASETGKVEIYEQLKVEVADLVETRPSGASWLPPLLEAGRMVKGEKRQALLAASLNALLALPPQALAQPVGVATLPFYDLLSALSADQLVASGQIERAFMVGEQIAMRKAAVRLGDLVGVEFFLTGLGEYTPELGGILQEMQTALREGQAQTLERLSAEFQDLLFVLYEQYPWAVSYLHQYEPASHLLSGVIRPDTPYLKVLPGQESLHVFLHDGETVRHAHVAQSAGQVASLKGIDVPIGQSSAIYVSVPADLRSLLEPLLPKGTTVVEVATVYDAVNAHHLRTLFASRVAIAGDLSLAGEDHASGAQVPVVHLTGNKDKDGALLAQQHVFVAAGPLEVGGFVVGAKLGVRDSVSLATLVGEHRHTAILLKLANDAETVRLIVVPALIRAGFSHVIVAKDVPLEQGHTFVDAYMKQVQGQRTDRAVMTANRAAAGPGDDTGLFQLYGFVGMDQDQKAAFASSEYKRAVSDTVAAYRAERFETALRRAEDALSILVFTKAGQDFRKLTDVAVDTAFKIGDYRTAVVHQTRLVEHIEKAGDTRAKAGALHRLGILYSRLEEFEPAIKHLESAIDLWRKQEELDRLAEGIATLGVVKENMGIYPEALDAFGRSFELYRELGEVQDMAAQHRRIGRIDYLRLSRYERARNSFSAALAIYKKLGERRAEAETLYEIGLTYEKIGLFDEADREYITGRRIGAELQDGFLLATGSLYLANTSWYRGRYQNAFEHLEVATREAEKSADHQLPIMIANTKALLYWTLNDLDKALVYAEQALAAAQREDIKTEIASSHNNLGLMLRDHGRVEASLKHFEQAKDIDDKTNSSWGLGYDHRNIGISLMKLGRHADARSHFEAAERYSAAIKNVDNWVKALLELGNVTRETGGYEASIAYYQRTYDISKRHHMKEVLWRASAGHGAVLRSVGRKEEAVRHYAEAVDIVESMRAALKVEEFRNSFQTKTQDLYRDIITVLIELGRSKEAFNYLERSRSRSFIDLLGNQKLELKTQTDQKALDRVTTLQARFDSLSRELASFETPPRDLVDRVRQAKAAYEEAFVRLKQSTPQLSSFIAVDPLTQDQVQGLLEPGVALLSYKVTTENVYLWLVTSSGTKFYQVPTAPSEVDRLVRTYRERVQRLESVSEELGRLSQLLIAPALADLAGVRYLGIIPDGPLHYLSFAALPVPDGVLVESYPLFYSPAGSVLKYTFAKRSAVKLTKVLAIGNPDLGNYNYQLPLAELEARSIRWDFPDLDVLTGAKATKEWIVANISRYGIIHLATHGEFDDLNPLLSSLWLASHNPGNRRLTVREVFGLNIRADLVTLSACQTGLGKLEAGELIGLNRAFIYAGTHALVSALWRVDDLATSVLMKHFYRNYVSMDKATSLRHAQLLVKKEFPHPAYWAGLALVGDYR